MNARMAMSSDWSDGRGLLDLLERFAETTAWDDRTTLTAAYERHNTAVRADVPADRLLEWRGADGWGPICGALGLPVPSDPFPWVNKRSEWTNH